MTPSSRQKQKKGVQRPYENKTSRSAERGFSLFPRACGLLRHLATVRGGRGQLFR